MITTTLMALGPLVVIPPERVAAELRRAVEIELGERQWRRGARRLAMFCGLTYAAGFGLAWSSLHLTGDTAQAALWGGLLLGNSGWLVYLLVMWAREDG